MAKGSPQGFKAALLELWQNRYSYEDHITITSLNNKSLASFVHVCTTIIEFASSCLLGATASSDVRLSSQMTYSSIVPDVCCINPGSRFWLDLMSDELLHIDLSCLTQSR